MPLAASTGCRLQTRRGLLSPADSILSALSVKESAKTFVVQFLIFGAVSSVALFSVMGASGNRSKSAVSIPAFSVSELSAQAGANWIHQDGNIQSNRYSTLSQINGSNGGSLKLA